MTTPDLTPMRACDPAGTPRPASSDPAPGAAHPAPTPRHSGAGEAGTRNLAHVPAPAQPPPGPAQPLPGSAQPLPGPAQPLPSLLITGATGFLGSELLRQLHARGATGVWALTRSPDDVPAWPGLTVLGYDDVKDFGFGEVGVMIHAAFPRDAAGAEMAAGVKATNELLAAAACGGVGAVVNVSSQSVYDRARTEPADEATPLAPATDYGRAKVEQEKVVAALFPPGRFTSVRLGSLVGPGFDVRVMNKFVAQARAGQDLRVMGGGQRFSYLDIRDAAAAFLALAEQPAASWRPLYVMGHPQAVTLLEMAEAVARLAPEYTGHDVAVNVEPGGKWTSTELAPAAFMQDTGWTPQYTLEATIRTLYEAA